MRILYDNKLLEASTVTATSENFNFPISNIITRVSDIYYASVAQSGVELEFNFDDPITADCLGLTNHNISSIQIETSLYGLGTYDSGVITTIYDTDVLYFGRGRDFDYIKITISTTESYNKIGHMSLGEYLEMPNPVSKYNEGPETTSEKYVTKFGNVYASAGVNLKKFDNVTFVKVSKSKMDEIKEMIDEVMNVYTLFMDIKHEAHDIEYPTYCTLSNSNYNLARYTGGSFYYKIALSFLEAR